MSSDDLMGGYAAYTTPNAAVQELATTGVEQAEAGSPLIITAISAVTVIVSPITITLL
ncbi:hypothetical protein AB0D49_24610 [Streptomyces sp. NPDC048290]|uniref:hypothetical protein n=1 Tax=Streptomyces sp. NPDC048290 TaxID=3155811 RepID=UPI00343EDAC8